MYRTDIKDRILEAENADLQYRDLVAKLQQSEGPLKGKVTPWKLMDYFCTKT
jgi:hypothetical protein